MKKKVKIIIIALVVVLVGYVYFMGGPLRAFEQVKNGQYLNFEDKNQNKEYVDVLVVFYDMFGYKNNNYTTRINLNKYNKLVKYQNSLGFNNKISEVEAKKIISEYNLNKINSSEDTTNYKKIWFSNNAYD